MVTLTSPPSTSTSRTMSSSVTGFRSSGSITRASALRISACVGTSRTGYPRNAATPPRRVLDRVALPVVVEVGEDVYGWRPSAEAFCPLVQLSMAVVPVRAARPPVEAHEREVGRELVGLEPVHLRTVADNERDVALTQERHDVRREPALVAELDAMAL